MQKKRKARRTRTRVGRRSSQRRPLSRKAISKTCLFPSADSKRREILKPDLVEGRGKKENSLNFILRISWAKLNFKNFSFCSAPQTEFVSKFLSFCSSPMEKSKFLR